MSNGGGESGKELEHSNHSKKNSRNEEFVHAIAKMAVAQVCESSGFQGFQQSALDTLSDIAVRYISHIGKTANSNANLAGRIECNVFDIIQGLEDLGMSQGFSGASDTNRCLAGSGAVQEIAEYVELAEELPFAYSIPRFPVTKERKPTPSFMQIGESPPGEHIPMWLPAFPDPETYTCMPVGSDQEGNEGMDKVVQVKEYRKLEGSVSNMHQRLDCNGSEIPISIDPGYAFSLKQAADSNPFLVAPLRFGEKEVSPVILPAKLSDGNVAQNRADWANHVSLLETSAPAVDAVKSKTFDSEEGNKKVLLNSRPAVQFKFQIGKKIIGSSSASPECGSCKNHLICWE